MSFTVMLCDPLVTSKLFMCIALVLFVRSVRSPSGYRVLCEVRQTGGCRQMTTTDPCKSLEVRTISVQAVISALIHGSWPNALSLKARVDENKDTLPC